MRFEDIHNVCVLGAGTMGPGAAVAFAAAGYNVRMWGREDSSLVKGQRGVDAALRDYHEHGYIDTRQAAALQSRILLTTSKPQALEAADLVFETVTEDMAVKHPTLGTLDQDGCPRGALIVTNTSSLPIDDIATVLSAERLPHFAAMHFFLPSHMNPLAEIVAASHTSQETIDAACKTMIWTGKEPVQLTQALPGYIVNRVQAAMWNAAFVLQSEASAHDIDHAVVQTLGQSLKKQGILDTVPFAASEVLTRDASNIANRVLYAMQEAGREVVDKGVASKADVNHAVKLTMGLRLPVTGPLASADITGLDTVLSILEKGLGYTAPEPLRRAVEEGRLGFKTGKGVNTAQGTFTWPLEDQRDIGERRLQQIIDYSKNGEAFEGSFPTRAELASKAPIAVLNRSRLAA